MQRKHTFLLFFYLVVCYSVHAQNLVPNGDFETYNSPGGVFPYSTTYTTFPIAAGWMNPKQTTPDYLNAAASGGYNVPNTYGGRRTAHSGNGIVGLDMVGWDPEHLECRLSQPLIAGHEYYVSLWVSKATNQWNASVNCFGVHLDNMMWLSPQTLTPTIIDTSIYPDTSWVEIKGVYTALGGEQWLTIGRTQPTFPVVVKPQGASSGYMFVDDICVYDIANSLTSRKDTTICGNTTLHSPHKGARYMWSTNDTGASLAISNLGGVYWVKTFSNCVVYVDTIKVHTKTGSILDIGKDVTVCDKPTVTIRANHIDYLSYLWNTGATTPIIDVDKSGQYYVTIQDSCGNTQRDTVNVQMGFTPDAPLVRDTSICQDDPSPVLWVVGSPIQWYSSDVSDSLPMQPAINTSAAGDQVLYVSQSNSCGTSKKAAIRIHIGAKPEVAIEGVGQMCEGDETTLHAVAGNAGPVNKLTWNTGDTNSSIQVHEAGTYSVTADNECGTAVDAMDVTVATCNLCVWVPDAFTPNGDGRNDVFRIVSGCTVSEFHLLIVNRYGQLVFESANVAEAWDGRFKGQPQEMGSYYYILEMTSRFVDGTSKQTTQKGNIMLIR